MSAPLKDPLVVNTQDGCCWTRRAVNRQGHGLYALADVQGPVPELVLATITELAEHGLSSMTDCLPVPVGDGLSEFERLRLRVDEVERKYTFDTAELKRRIAELEAERHTTNEALDDAVAALRALERKSEADGITRVIAPTQALQKPAEDVSPQVQRLRSLLAGQRGAVDGEHYAAVHHNYRVGRDLPPLGGIQ